MQPPAIAHCCRAYAELGVLGKLCGRVATRGRIVMVTSEERALPHYFCRRTWDPAPTRSLRSSNDESNREDKRFAMCYGQGQRFCNRSNPGRVRENPPKSSFERVREFSVVRVWVSRSQSHWLHKHVAWRNISCCVARIWSTSTFPDSDRLMLARRGCTEQMRSDTNGSKWKEEFQRHLPNEEHRPHLLHLLPKEEHQRHLPKA